MKFILCTGDSHTEGQYADGTDGWLGENFQYKIKGKGFGRTFFESGTYVNLVRDFVVENTNSQVENVELPEKCDEYARFQKIQNQMTVPIDCDCVILRVAEKNQEAQLGIYLDEKKVRTKMLQAETTRFGDWSICIMMIPTKGAKEITLKAECGEVFIDSFEKWSGDYAVVNCGVGSCMAGRYKDECLPALLSEFPDIIFVAELHTINNWIWGDTKDTYRKDLSEMLDIMIKNSTDTLAVTVTPILHVEPVRGVDADDFYEKFVDIAYEVIKEKNIPVIDAHKEFSEKIKGKTPEELVGTLYGDRMHPRQPGYDLYAKLIIEKLRSILK